MINNLKIHAIDFLMICMFLSRNKIAFWETFFHQGNYAIGRVVLPDFICVKPDQGGG